MEITPPVSPQAHSIGVISGRGIGGFECLGGSGVQPFHPRGFVCSGEVDLFNISQPNLSAKQCFIKVFGELYHIEFSQNDLERMFLAARNRLCIMDAALRSNVGTYGLFTGNMSSRPQTDFSRIRMELRDFFLTLRHLITVESCDQEYSWVLKELLPTLAQGLSLLRLQLGWLSDLPSYILNHGSGQKDNSKAAFHLFHCHLELRWLHISVLRALSLAHINTELSQTSMSHWSDVYGSVELCMWDLMKMGESRFSKFKEESIVQESLFNCMCVKELWFLLKCAIETSQDSPEKSFWKVLDGKLTAIVPASELPTFSEREMGYLAIPLKLDSQNPLLFSLWILRHLSELFMYDQQGRSVNQEKVEGNQGALKQILGRMIDSPVSSNEAHCRIILYFVKKLMTEFWVSKPEPIMMLWECFSRKLDSAFQRHGAPASSFIVPCDSAADILNSVNNILAAELFSQTRLNSYEMFLSLLGQYLSENPAHWKQKMQGRFNSKISPRKVQTLSEMGLYHLTQLFLIVATKTDSRDVAGQFQTLLSLGIHVEGNERAEDNKKVMILKAYLSFVLLHFRKKWPLAFLLNPIVESISKCVESKQYTLPRIFVGCLKDIVLSNDELFPDLHLVIGKWMYKYLCHHHQDSVASMLHLLLSALRTLEDHLEKNCGVIGEEVVKLMSALWEHLFPYVKEQMAGNWASVLVADLAVSFTTLSLHSRDLINQKTISYSSLINQFLFNESSNIILVRRFLYTLLSRHKGGEIEELQISLFQAWVRCCSLSELPTHDELIFITRKVLGYNVIQKETNIPFSDLKTVGTFSDHHRDPLCSFFEVLGKQGPKQYCKGICNLLSPMKQMARACNLQLFCPKPKAEGMKADKKVAKELSRETIMRSYYVLGKLVLECGEIIYPKGVSDGLLFLIIRYALLPPSIYSSGAKLPLAVDEALRNSLLFFMRGLYKLEPDKDSHIKKQFNDCIIIYVPRMVGETGSLMNPFVKIWDDPEYIKAGTGILKALCGLLLTMDKSNAHPSKDYLPGLQVLSELMLRNSADEGLLSIVFQHGFPRILEVMGRTTDLSSRAKCKGKTDRTLRLLFDSQAYLQNPTLWEVTINELIQLSKKYLKTNFDMLKRIINFLMEVKPLCIKKFLPRLKKVMEEEIAGCGMGSNKQWELWYEYLVKSFEMGSASC